MLTSKAIKLVLIGLLLLAGQAIARTDPTKPPEFTEPTTTAPVNHTLTLSMILREGNSRRAIINENVVGVNDKIEGATVMAIKQDSVVLRRGDKTIVLEIPIAGVRKEREHE